MRIGNRQYETVADIPAVVPVCLVPRRETAARWADGLRGGFAVNGRYEVTHLEPGTWTVIATPVTADGSIPLGSTVIEIPAEGTIEANVLIEPRR